MQRPLHLLLFVIFISQQLYSQSKQPSLNLNFNEKLNMRELGLHEGDQFNWRILDSNQQQITQQQGQGLFQYVFANPGRYHLQISNITSSAHEGCNHETSDQIFDIFVSPFALNFDLNQIQFSSQLTSSQLANGLEISVPFHLEMVAGGQAKLATQALEARFQGVGCRVETKVLNPQVLDHSGDYTIKFFVKGTAEPRSYIMIDFVDPSGKISTYYHTTEL
jgi:hypothetical protein